jgi:hypothetical protein
VIHQAGEFDRSRSLREHVPGGGRSPFPLATDENDRDHDAGGRFRMDRVGCWQRAMSVAAVGRPRRSVLSLGADRQRTVMNAMGALNVRIEEVEQRWTPSFGQENAETKLGSQALLH